MAEYKYYTTVLVYENGKERFYGGEKVIKALNKEDASKIEEQSKFAHAGCLICLHRKVLYEYSTRKEAEQNLKSDFFRKKRNAILRGDVNNG